MPKSKVTLKRRKLEESPASDDSDPEIHQIDDDESEVQEVIVISKSTNNKKKQQSPAVVSNLEKDEQPATRSSRRRAANNTKTGSGMTKLQPSPALPPNGGAKPGKMNLRRLEAMARATTTIATKNQLQRDSNQDGLSGTTTTAESLPWVDRNFPSKLEEHFVHKKKIADLKAWIERALSPNPSFKSKMCLLTGPTGSGKTATVHLLAKELEVDVKEWINPLSLTEYQVDRSGSDDIHGRSQFDLFSDFLLRSSQYTALPMKGKKVYASQVVVVEDIPNVFFRDTDSFHNLLRNYNTCGVSPVIFIFSESNQGSHNPLRLFTASVLQELRIEQLSFNAVATSFMVKFLALVCARENVSIQQPILEAVAAASGGDMRCAINTLQFKILQERPPTKDTEFKRPLPKTKRVTRDNVLKSNEYTNKDESLFLFRALGKVLYNKRNKTVRSSVEQELHPALDSERRDYAPEDDPEEIAGRIEVSPESFLGFLSQNYPSFFGSIEQASKAASYLSEAENLFSRWNYEDSSYGSNTFRSQDRKEQLGLSLAIRGLMHSNNVPTSSRWRPLKKPIFSDVHSKTRQIIERSRVLFPTLNCFVESFYHQDIPLLGKVSSPGLSPDQRALVQEVGLFKDLKTRGKWTETLNENNFVDDKNSDEDPISDTFTKADPAVPRTVEIKPVATEAFDEDPEEFEIEEYED